MSNHLNDKVSGKFILEILNGFGSNVSWIKEAFKKHNIMEIIPEKDYPVRFCLQLIEILKDESGINTIFKLGLEASKIYIISKDYNSFKTPHEIFPFFDYAYKLNIKTSEENSFYYYEKISEKQAIFRSSTLFPCDFERGFIFGVLKHYFDISYNEIEISHKPELACRNYGNPYCSYLISWK